MLRRMTVCSGNLRDISQMTRRREKARWGSDYRTVDKVGALGRVVSLGFSRGVGTSSISKARQPGWDAQGQSTEHRVASGKDKPLMCLECDQPPSPAWLGIYDQVAL